MIGYTGVFCIERDEQARLYKRTRYSDKRHDVFPMGTAVIAVDSHGCWCVYTLMYEPLARGLWGGEESAKQAIKELQPDVEKLVFERVRYITRCGVTMTQNTDVYKLK